MIYHLTERGLPLPLLCEPYLTLTSYFWLTLALLRAGRYVRKGNQALRDALEAQKKTRKCYCCLMIIALIVVLCLVAGLGTFFSGAITKTG